jgi:sigma-E factor negative regulatory protein RseA
MKADVSALMDDALEDGPRKALFDRLAHDPSLRQTWLEYHLIGDVLRGSTVTRSDVADRVLAALAQEPTVLAPMRVLARKRGMLRLALPIAASIMGIGAVAWVAQTLTPPPVGAVAALQSLAPLAAAPVPASAVGPRDAIELASFSQVRPYLFAHQGYSLQSGIQGVTPYVRTVSAAGEGSGR